MTKRVITMLIALCMVFSVLAGGMTVSAAEADELQTISRITVNGDITEPVGGEAPVTEGLSVTLGYLDEEGEYVEAADWQDPEKETLIEWKDAKGNSVEKFVEGKTYNLTVSAYIDTDAYEFEEFIEVYVGDEYYSDLYSGEFSYAVCAEIEYHIDGEVIESVDVSGVVDAAVGADITVEGITVPEDANYSISSIGWYDYSDDSLAEGKFEEKKAYELRIFLSADDGYELDHSTTVLVDGAEYDSWYMEDDEIVIYSYHSFLEPIAEVKLPEYVPAAVGAEASSQTIDEEGANYTVYAEWYTVTENGYETFEGVFEEGTVYYYEAYAEADEGYEFTDDTVVTVGDETADSGYVTNYGYLVSYDRYVALGMDTVDKVEITAAAPEVGKDAYSLAINVPEDAKYSVAYFEIIECEENDIIMSDYMMGGKFAEDMYYWYDFGIMAEDGYIFADDAEVYVNGKPVKNAYVGTDAVSFTHGFGQLKKIEDTSKIFKDVKAESWYQEYVDYVYAYGLMNGTNDGDTFEPTSTVTRSMIVTVLARIAGIDTEAVENEETKFTDVETGKWYSGAVVWALESGITTGTSDTTFSPADNVTREDICTFIVRFANYSETELNTTAEKTEFTDDAEMGSWAKDAVYACQQAEIVNGKPGNVFDPKGEASRAEIAKIIAVFYQDYINA